MYTPVKLSFTILLWILQYILFYYIKVGFNGVKIIQICFRDDSRETSPLILTQLQLQIYFRSPLGSLSNLRNITVKHI